MSQIISEQIFESFLNPAERGRATYQLASLGIEAIPILESLFSGKAKNRWGISYSKLGSPIDCGLVAAKLLGSTAKPLEPLIRVYFRSGHLYAAQALAAIRHLDEVSIIQLAACLDQDTNFVSEVAYTLCCCGVEEHKAVTNAVNSSPFASQILSSVRSSYLEKDGRCINEG